MTTRLSGRIIFRTKVENKEKALNHKTITAKCSPAVKIGPNLSVPPFGTNVAIRNKPLFISVIPLVSTTAIIMSMTYKGHSKWLISCVDRFFPLVNWKSSSQHILRKPPFPQVLANVCTKTLYYSHKADLTIFFQSAKTSFVNCYFKTSSSVQFNLNTPLAATRFLLKSIIPLSADRTMKRLWKQSSISLRQTTTHIYLMH